MACRVITEEPFQDITEETLKEAMDVMDECREVIYTGYPLGRGNERINELLETASREKKLKVLINEEQNI